MVVGAGVGVMAGLIGICHSCVLGSLSPTRTNVLSLYNRHSFSLKMTLYSATQNFLVEMRDECDKPGTM